MLVRRVKLPDRLLLAASQLVTPKSREKFVIATVCLSATLASDAPAEDKPEAQDAPVYQGA